MLFTIPSLEPQMRRVVRHRDLLGIGAAHDREFGLGHRLFLSAHDGKMSVRRRPAPRREWRAITMSQ
jgi:hypothetical protein